VDVLRLPVIGAVVRWPHVRLVFQLALLALTAIVVIHGVFGPQIAPRNLATVLTSIHWRGLLIVAIVIVGNVFCFACPLVLARDAGRRIVTPRWSWPRWLRRKWIAVAALLMVLFSYELFDLWDSPSGTAWLILGYFGVALAVDLLFKGATFCKYVCPVGQFNFIASTMSPAEVTVRNAAVCSRCRTSDCIKGQRASLDALGAPPSRALRGIRRGWPLASTAATSATAEPLRIVRRGCELGLFLPTKVGNLDCTLCLDCVHACPHDNVALTTRVPGIELLDTKRRSAIGRLARRSDVAALATVFTFAALVNAFAMTAPAFALERRLANLLGISSETVVLALIFAMGLVLAPALVLSVAAIATRVLAGDARMPLGPIAVRYAFALVPLGVGVWLAHYGFHLLTGMFTVIPVTQSAAIDLVGWAALGEPAWQWAGLPPGSVFALQLGFVLLGACGSIGLVHGVSRREYPDRLALAAVPWHSVVVALAAIALWILTQPMEMRGLGGIG
jgi:polyferredoxin